MSRQLFTKLAFSAFIKRLSEGLSTEFIGAFFYQWISSFS
ncbi:protein of unknown function [Petrocella atlantisensis]|uniref:Uncharacterized protein n=1 Tax=Petrocella atlantisensis TaxID=2173034 RepID=A0A3P7Q078_9FIRM|nr:protein of unknown function [Petrocella atlantisensis]